MVATSKEALTHFLTNVLDLFTHDIEALESSLGLLYMRNLFRIDYEHVTDQRASCNITSLCYITLADFMLYYNSTTPTPTLNQIMELTQESRGIMANIITPTQINAAVFLKYYTSSCLIKVASQSSTRTWCLRPHATIFSSH